MDPLRSTDQSRRGWWRIGRRSDDADTRAVDDRKPDRALAGDRDPRRLARRAASARARCTTRGVLGRSVCPVQPRQAVRATPPPADGHLVDERWQDDVISVGARHAIAVDFRCAGGGQRGMASDAELALERSGVGPGRRDRLVARRSRGSLHTDVAAGYLFAGVWVAIVLWPAAAAQPTEQPLRVVR